MKPLPMHGDKTIVEHITVGLAKVSAVLRSQAWEGGTARKLTPTQGQILVLLEERAGQPMRLNDVANTLGVTAATASDAVAALEQKRFVRKQRSTEDNRALTLTLTATGRREAHRSGGWSDVVRAGVQSLSVEEQTVFVRGLTKVIRSLQDQGAISTVRMCAGCSYFRPYAHVDSAKPHHCAFVNSPIGEGQLRLDCPDFVTAPEAEGASRWQEFLSGGKGR